MTPKKDSRLSKARRQPSSHHWQVAIHSNRCYIPWLRQWTAACIAESGLAFSARSIWRCGLVVVEAINNAMLHAHRGHRDAWIGLEIAVARHRVTMTVTDQGPPFVKPHHRRPPATRIGGRGFYLMQSLCRRVVVRRIAGRNLVRMYYDEKT